MQDAGSAPVSFGKYLLDAELARGGMSRVWQARLRGPGGFEKQLVVKQILPQLAQDPSFVELLVQEANTLVRMSHPNIVPVYELGIVDGVYFLAMERVHGATVGELLRAQPLPPALVAELGAQVSEALRYAHERFELVHRDVTPRNVMVDADGHVRLLDFGIAAPSARTGKGELFGSPGYMSPEQEARKALTPASDLFGLGALLYEALTGRRAVVAGVAARLGGDPGADAELAALIDELLDADPETRGSAARTASRLRGWLAQKQPEGAREQLGRRVDQLLADAARGRRAGEAADDGAARARGQAGGDGSVGEGATPGTPGVTRSIATSATLTELLTTGATEALPKPGAPAVQLQRSRGPSVATAMTIGAAGLAAAAWLLVARDVGPEQARAPAAPEVGTAPGTGIAPRVAPTPAVSAASAPAAGRDAPAQAPPAGGGAGSELADVPEPRALAAPSGSATAAPPAAGPSALLTIHATPWAEARLDGKTLGPTPLRGLRVRAGAHVLTLECPPLGKKARVPLRLSAGGHAQVVADMEAEPPQVSVR